MTTILSLLFILLLVLLTIWIKFNMQFGVINNTSLNKKYYVIYYTVRHWERKIIYLFYKNY